MCLWNRLLHTYNYDYERVTINGAQVRVRARRLVDHRRVGPAPGHPNWVSTAGHRTGRIWFRWFLPAEHARAAPGRGRPGGHGMSARPAPVRIDDLAEPRYSDEVRAILDFMEEAGSQLTLEPAALMAAATAETGLDDFGADDFVERLDVLCRAMREEGGFNGAGILQQHTFILGLLKNRLLIEDLVAAPPRDPRRARSPPRSSSAGCPGPGTTHLHNLMSADPALRSLPYWESLEPVLAEREQPAPGAPDPRLERTAMALSFLDVAMPYFKRMHEMTVEHTHEEIQLLAIDFSTMLFETTAPMPTWRDDYLARDQRPSYAYLLQGAPGAAVAARRHALGAQVAPAPRAVPGPRRHLPRRHLRRHPPRPGLGDGVDGHDARLLGPAHPRPGRPRGHGRTTGRTASSACCAAAPTTATSCPADQTIDVHFDEFMADDLAMVARVYDLAGQPLDERARASMAAFMAEHPRGQLRHRRVRPGAVRPRPGRAPPGPVPSTPIASACT